MSALIVDLQNATAGFLGRAVLKGLSLQVEKGSMVLVEGPTGSGKTTLIKLLTGGLGMEAGFGCVAGFNLPGISAQELTALRRRLGLVFQTPRFLDQENVLTNVTLPLAITGHSRSECRSRGTRALIDADLTGHARKYPSELSGGEQARLQIARALIHRPFLLLADEPFAHLDPESAAAAEALIVKAHARGTTVLVTTHQSTHLAKHATRFAMEGGSLYSVEESGQ